MPDIADVTAALNGTHEATIALILELRGTAAGGALDADGVRDLCTRLGESLESRLLAGIQNAQSSLDEVTRHGAAADIAAAATAYGTLLDSITRIDPGVVDATDQAARKALEDFAGRLEGLNVTPADPAELDGLITDLKTEIDRREELGNKVGKVVKVATNLARLAVKVV
jgi:hypothetical protein